MGLASRIEVIVADHGTYLHVFPGTSAVMLRGTSPGPLVVPLTEALVMKLLRAVHIPRVTVGNAYTYLDEIVEEGPQI